MIIDDLDIVGLAIVPPETNTPLVIDPNAVLAVSITRELFQAISRRDAQVIQSFRRINEQELSSAPPDAMSLRSSFAVRDEKVVRSPGPENFESSRQS